MRFRVRPSISNSANVAWTGVGVREGVGANIYRAYYPVIKHHGN